MKAEFNQRILTLENTIYGKDTEIAELKVKVASNDKVKTPQQAIQKMFDNHQNFLEKTDSFRRETNVVIYGLSESEEQSETDQVAGILQRIECPNVAPEKCRRLGKVVTRNVEQVDADEPERPPRPRPILVTLKSISEKSRILSNSKKLKDETYKKVFIKKDQSPHERNEWARLRGVLKREKGRPENAGIEVKIDYRTSCVKVGEHIVDKANFRRGPEL